MDENGEWRRLHNEELHSLYRSPNIVRVIKSRRLKWSGYVARMERGRSAFKIFTGKPTEKRPLGRSTSSLNCLNRIKCFNANISSYKI